MTSLEKAPPLRACQVGSRRSSLPALCVALIGTGLSVSCSAIDERDPDISSMMTGPEQAEPSLRPNPAGGGAAGSRGTGGPAGSSPASSSPAMSGAAGSQAGGPAPVPGAADAQCPSADNAPCTTPSSRAGACSQLGQCIEYCAAGVSLAGACLVQPG